MKAIEAYLDLRRATDFAMSNAECANGYELVVFDLPAANGWPAQIGWELFGGIGYSTLIASGQAANLSEAKDTCEAALVQRWLLDIR